MKNIKDTKSAFIIIRVTLAEKLDFIKKAQDSKNLSHFIRHLLGLDK